MGGRVQYEIPAKLKEAQERFEQWRGSHSGRRPIPESLWGLASELARQHGVFRTAQVLRLDYNKLKRRTPGTASTQAPAASRVPSFRRTDRTAATAIPCECTIELEGPRGRMRIEWKGTISAGPGRLEPCAVGAGRLIQITPQIRILVAVEPIDARKGIDSLAQLCREKLAADPFSGCLFIFRSRRGTAIKLLAYDGQGFWLATKRLSKGRFRWWPTGDEPARVLRAHQAQLLLAAANPEAEAPPEWRRVSG